MSRMRSVDKASGLLTIDLLSKVTMKKGIRDIHLMNWPATRDCELQNGANRARFNNRREGLGEVDASTLTETTDHPASLVARKGAIGVSLVPKDPLATDDIGARWPGNQCPSAVPL
jgi:hypothetical protein